MQPVGHQNFRASGIINFDDANGNGAIVVENTMMEDFGRSAIDVEVVLSPAREGGYALLSVEITPRDRRQQLFDLRRDAASDGDKVKVSRHFNVARSMTFDPDSTLSDIFWQLIKVLPTTELIGNQDTKLR